MNRKFACQLVESIGQNMMGLVEGKIPSYNNSFDAIWLAMTKLKMTIHARFLSQLIQDLFTEDNPIMMAEDSAEKMEQLYYQIWNDCYDYEIPFHRYKFSQFWDGLVEFNKIAIEDLPKYEDAKVQIFILWRTVGNLFFNGQEKIYDDYVIKEDNEFINGALNRGCSHKQLDRVISLIYNQDYIPVHYDWKDSSVPAVLKPYCDSKELGKKQPEILRSQYGSRTLGDVWEDFSVLQFVDKSIPKYMVLLCDVDNELAQALGELSNTYITVIDVLAHEKDLLGNVWDDILITEEQLRKLEENRITIDKLTKEKKQDSKTIKNYEKKAKEDRKTIQQLAKSLVEKEQTKLDIDTLNELARNASNNDKADERVYSRDKEEAAMEKIGSEMKRLPILLPTRIQKAEHLDCRWILTCNSTEKGYKPSVETYIHAWFVACEYEGLAFFNQQTLKNGLYLLIDGILIKATARDRKLSWKLKNALTRDPIHAAQDGD